MHNFFLKKRLFLFFAISSFLNLVVQETLAAELAPKNASIEELLPKFTDKIDMERVLSLKNDLQEISEGELNSPVTIVEYFSLSCPHCATFYLDILPKLRDNYIRKGKLRLILREFSWDPYATAGFAIARCVSSIQYGAVIKNFLSNQMSWLSGSPETAKNYLYKVGHDFGLSDKVTTACIENKKIIGALTASFNDGKDQIHVNATPTMFINGYKYVGELSYSRLSSILDILLLNKNK